MDRIGATTPTWNNNNTPCSWYGVICEAGSVIWLSLNHNDLSGSIPPELGDLSNLIGLKLRSNDLSGSIPTQISGLSSLSVLALNNNNLSGDIPSHLSNLSNLEYLFLAYNDFSGSIPPELGDLSNLSSLWLNNNQLSGSIPPELGDLSNLTELWLNDNQLSGNIPESLVNLVNLWDGLSSVNDNMLNVTGYNQALIDFLNVKFPGWATIQAGSLPDAIGSTPDPITRIAPVDGAVWATGADYVSKFQWAAQPTAEWYHIFVATPDLDTVFLDRWYLASQVCIGSICTLPDDVWLVGSGEFAWWMTYWSESIGDVYIDFYNETRFNITMPTPGTLTGGAYADGMLTWQAEPNTLWYNIGVNSDYGDTPYLTWHDAADICNEGTCSFNIGALAPGDYDFWVQGWNPVGLTVGEAGWQKLAEFSIGG